MQIEKRILSTASNLRASGSGDSLVLQGYAAKFNVLSHDLGNYREKIAPGAFTKSIAAGDDVVCTFNHDPNSVLGRTKSGTLKLAQDDTGLAFRCQLDPNQQAHKDLHAAVKRGDIQDCSFAFQCPEDGCDFAQRGVMEDGKTPCNIRTLRNVTLLDCSVVVHPAYPSTQVDARRLAPVVSDQTVIRAQIVAWESRRKQRIADARSIGNKYPGVCLEDIAIRARIYSGADLEDSLLQLRSAAYARTIRQGGGLEPLPMRADGGSAQDPQCLLRGDDKEAFDWDDDDWNKDEHDRAAAYHRACARKASTMDQGIEHFKCADLHDAAARHYPDLNPSFAARAASKRLALADVS